MSSDPKVSSVVGESEKSKIDIIEEALLKNIAGGGWTNTCGTDAGTNCWHDTCYAYLAKDTR